MAAILVDEAGKVAINSKETIAALNYLKDLYATFVPGTLAWGDPSNNRAYAANEVWLTANGVSLYFALKNDPATRAIAEDTEHQFLPFGVVGKPPQGSLILNAHGVQAHKVPKRGQGLHPVHDGVGAVRSRGSRGASATGRTRCAPTPRARCGSPIPSSPSTATAPRTSSGRLQGADHARRRHRLRRVHHGADVRLRRLGPGNAAKRRPREAERRTRRYYR